MSTAKLKSLSETKNGNLFSICLEGDSITEFEKFIENHSDAYSKEVNMILSAIQHMLNASGFLERYFRPEGKMNDSVCALPLTSGKLRLYCLRINDSILIAGNGGVKSTRTYEDDQLLSGHVITLQKLEIALKKAIRKGEAFIEGNSIEHHGKKFDIS